MTDRMFKFNLVTDTALRRESEMVFMWTVLSKDTITHLEGYTDNSFK